MNDVNTNENESLKKLIGLMDKVDSIVKSTAAFDERIKNNEFIKAYNGVGECWTWKEGHGSPYCGDNNGITVTLQGWVDPSDVDWEETVYRNAYSLNEEMELYIPNATVEVFSISVGEEDEEKRKLPLKRPILVKA